MAAGADVGDRTTPTGTAADAPFRAMVEAAPVAIVGVGADGRIALVNAQGERLFGYGRAELEGQPVELLVPEADRELHARHQARYLANPVTRPMGAVGELTGRRKDGSRFPAEISLSPVMTDDGLLVAAAVRDVTEHIETLRALEEQAAKLADQARLLDLAHDAIIVRGLDGAIRYWSHGAEAAYGWTRREAIGRSSHELLWTEFPEPLEDLERTALETGHWDGELVNTRRDGSRIVVASRWAVQRDDRDAPVAFLEVNRDVTVQRQAELAQRRERDRRAADAMRREREFSSAVVDTADALVVVLDRDGRITRFNRAAERCTGYATHEVIGRRPWEVWLPGGDAAATEAYFTADPLPAGSLELPLDAGGGDRRHVLWTSAELRDGDGRAFVVATGIDVTERKHAEEALAANLVELDRRATELERSNRELEHFAYLASHDLSAPLRSVGLFTQLLARRYQGRLDSDADEYVGHIVEGVGRMRAIIDDLLSYARVGQSELEEAPVDLAELVERTVETLDLRSEAKLEVGPLPTVVGDATKLGQVVQNLLANATKFTRQARPSIVVGATRDGDAWRISIADDGIGIDPSHADRIFTMFQRLNRDYAGTGLGLALVKRIVDRHGGRIWFEPREGGGTVFNFTIPDRTEAS